MEKKKLYTVLIKINLRSVLKCEEKNINKSVELYKT